MASQSVGIRHRICVAVLCFLLNAIWIVEVSGGATPGAPSSTGDAGAATGQPSFVREFSSAQDVRRAHPVLDRTLDIVAGPKKADPAVDVLQTPHAVTTDSRHRVFVTDVSPKKVHVFDFANSKYSVLQNSGDRLHWPVGIATDSEGNVYVTDGSLGTILVYDSRGKFRRYLKESNGHESYFQSPVGIAVSTTTEQIYVCDSPRHMVIVLDKKGHVIDRFGKRGGGTKPGEFRYPTQLVAAGDELFILDSGNRRVQILDMRGRFRREIKVGYTDNSTGLAVDEDRNIYVTDDVVNQVQVFNHGGRLLYAFGQPGTKASEFEGVSGLWVDSGHCLYVVDARNKRIQEFQIAGQNVTGCQ